MEETVNNVVSNRVNEIELLTSINDSLSVINCFLVFFVLVIICYFAYKFFDMFFKI